MNSGIGDKTFGIIEQLARQFNNINTSLSEDMRFFHDKESIFQEKYQQRHKNHNVVGR